LASGLTSYYRNGARSWLLPPQEKHQRFQAGIKSAFLQILSSESVEFVYLPTVNEIVNQRHHNTASHDIA
jgi:hypothetical protein